MPGNQQDVVISVNGRNNTGPMFSSIRRDLDSVGRSARAFGQGFRLLVTGGAVGGLARRAFGAAAVGGRLRDTLPAGEVKNIDKAAEAFGRLGVAIDRIVVNIVSAIPNLNKFADWLSDIAARAGGEFGERKLSLSEVNARLNDINSQWWHPRQINPLAVNEERRRLEIRKSILEANEEFGGNAAVQAAQAAANRVQAASGRGQWINQIKGAFGITGNVLPNIPASDFLRSAFGGLHAGPSALSRTLGSAANIFGANRIAAERERQESIQRGQEILEREKRNRQAEISSRRAGVAPMEGRFLSRGMTTDPNLQELKKQTELAKAQGKRLDQIATATGKLAADIGGDTKEFGP